LLGIDYFNQPFFCFVYDPLFVYYNPEKFAFACYDETYLDLKDNDK
jgi:hypothetical protein